MEIDKIIEKRIQAIKTAHASNRIECTVNEEEHLAMLERAKEPISNEEFAEREVRRIYANMGLNTNLEKSGDRAYNGKRSGIATNYPLPDCLRTIYSRCK